MATLEIRNALVNQYTQEALRMAEGVCRKLPNWADRDAVRQTAIVGLLDAAHRFNSTDQSTFMGFARRRIYGEVTDYLRSLDSVSRGTREWTKQITTVKRKLERQLDRMPETDEIAATLRLSLDEYYRIQYRMGAAYRISLENVPLEHLPQEEQTPETNAALNEGIRALAYAMSQLRPRLRLVITLYYYYEITFRDIGRILGCTEVRICQLHKKAMTFLRTACASAAKPAECPVVVFDIRARPEYREALGYKPHTPRA